MNWKKEHETILKQWKSKIFVKLWLQNQSSYFYKYLNNLLSYPIIILSSASSATLFVSNQNTSSSVNLIVGLLTLITGILASINRHLKPSEVETNYKLTTHKYSNLIRNIDSTLSLTENMREPVDIFLERVSQEIDTIEENELEPLVYVKNKFEKQYGSIDRMLYGEDLIQILKLGKKIKKIYEEFKLEEVNIQKDKDLFVLEIEN